MKHPLLPDAMSVYQLGGAEALHVYLKMRGGSVDHVCPECNGEGCKPRSSALCACCDGWGVVSGERSTKVLAGKVSTRHKGYNLP